MNKEALCRPFPAAQIKQRPGRAGMSLSYLETHSVIHRLNECAPGWVFEVLQSERTETEILVRGRMTIGEASREQWGSDAIAKNGKGEPVSLGDNYKAATSDCIKKCATLFGVGLELYGDLPVPMAETEATPPPPPVKAVENLPSVNICEIRLKPGETGEMASKRQIEDIRANITRLRFNSCSWTSWLAKQTGRTQSKQLTKTEASTVLDTMMRMRPEDVLAQDEPGANG